MGFYNGIFFNIPVLNLEFVIGRRITGRFNVCCQSLIQLVGQRRRFLGYIKAQDFERYRKIINELGLRR